MAKVWEELTDGTMKLTVSPDEGGPASVFYGKTREEIYDKVVDSQANANRRIEQLRVSNGNGKSSHAPPPPADPRPLTANERMQAVSDLSNPATVDKGVTRLMESVIGPIDQFRADREAQKAERLEQAAILAAEEFSRLTPDFVPTDFNTRTLVNYMSRLDYPPDDVASYQRAYAELSGAKLLQQPPPTQTHDEAEPPIEPQERNAPTLSAPRAPARYSTGVRQSDISGTAPVPVKRLKWSREQIANLSAAEFKQHVNDPEFQFCVDYYSKTQKKKAVAV